VLGPTENLSAAAKHLNIRILNPIIENLHQTLAKDNFAGINIGKAYNVTISNPIIRAAPTSGYLESSYSAYNGIEIIGSENVTFDNPTIAKCANAAISFYDSADTGTVNWGGGCTYVTINGGTIPTQRQGSGVQADHRNDAEHRGPWHQHGGPPV
jgi:hypothetical protein